MIQKDRELCYQNLSNMMTLGFSKKKVTDLLSEYSSMLTKNKLNL